jgi:signal transduction histidine kinase
LKSPRRLLALFAILLPPVLLAGVGIRASRSEEARLEREVGRILQRRLAEQAAVLGEVVSRLERELYAATENLPTDPDRVRASAAHSVRLRHLLILDPRGGLLFPPPAGPESADERRFLGETRALWDRGNIAYPPRADGAESSADHGWQGVGWGDGGALFWRRLPDGRRAVVEVSAAALLAALIERLPVTSERAGGRPLEERIALYDGTGRVAYQWGRYQPSSGSGTEPLYAVSLAPPLESWRLGYLGPAPPRGRPWGLAVGVVALAAVLGLAGLWVHRENGRALREAAQRVSFVNQVSHELKTPLTNVRLYAELLEDHLPEDDGVAHQRLGVLLAECRRLGRLITNVLTFARAQKSTGTIALHPAPASVDQLVRELADQFAPAFAAKGIALQIEAAAPRPVKVDGDALAQMLGNLFGNVEKYAPGAPLRVRTEQERGRVRISVEDGGPGVPAGARERVFEPFVRLGGTGHEAVPGTGIGLGIARDLARLHGGDLRCLPTERATERGARFELTLAVEEVA